MEERLERVFQLLNSAIADCHVKQMIHTVENLKTVVSELEVMHGIRDAEFHEEKDEAEIFVSKILNSYRKAGLNEVQIGYVRWGFQCGLSAEEVAVYAKKEFHPEQMRMCLLGFRGGLTIEEVMGFAKADIPWREMQKTKEALILEKALERAREDFWKFCEGEGFSEEQLKEIQLGFAHGLELNEISFYAKLKFDAKQMEQIRIGFEDGLAVSRVKLYAKSELSAMQMHTIRSGLQNRESIEQVKVYAKACFSVEQMMQMRFGYQVGLSIDQVQLFAKPELSWSEMMNRRMELALKNEAILEAMGLRGYRQVDMQDGKISFQRIDDDKNHGDTAGWTFQYDTWGEVRASLIDIPLWEDAEMTSRIDQLIGLTEEEKLLREQKDSLDDRLDAAREKTEKKDGVRKERESERILG